ncbi:MAG TPA: hypothetical protein VMM76_12065 [Pirellulaceae bacterium]|nr:hypothetical protein [Pirellulaceae bacterium]
MHQELHLNKARRAEMVVSAQSGSNATQHELVALAENFKNNLVANLGRRDQLTTNDIEDVQQQGVFWILEAIQHYDAGPNYFRILK